MVLVPFRGSSCILRIRHRHYCWMRIYRLMFHGYFSTPLYHNSSHSTGVTSRTAKHLQFNARASPAPYTPVHMQNDFFLDKKWTTGTAALTVHQESTVTAPKSMTAAKRPVAEPSEIMPLSRQPPIFPSSPANPQQCQLKQHAQLHLSPRLDFEQWL